MRSDRSCLRTPVAYSISPCSAVMMREATLPLSRMEKDRCASRVRMKVSRKCFLVSSWPNNVKAFSTLAGTWERGDGGDDGKECEERERGLDEGKVVGHGEEKMKGRHGWRKRMKVE